MDDMISRQAAITILEKVADLYPYKVPGIRDTYSSYNEAWQDGINMALAEIENMPSAQLDLNEWCMDCKEYDKERYSCPRFNRVIREALKDAEPKYTVKELTIFLHGLSLRLLSLRSAQHWNFDTERANEIEFLAHLYEKVEADMKGKT